MRWSRIVPALAVALLVMGLVLYALCSLVAMLFRSTPVFCHLVPKNAPLVVEGSPQQVTAFVSDKLGTATLASLGFNPQAIGECSNVLYAELPTSDTNASKDCQRNIIKLVNTIEDSWNKDLAYPRSLPLLPPCPAQGHLTYSSDGEAFSLSCESSSHQTFYHSEAGLDTGRAVSPTYIMVLDHPSVHQANSFTLPDREGLEILSNAPRSAWHLLDTAAKKKSTLALADAPDSALRLSMTAQEFSKLFPASPMRLPADCRISAWYNQDSSALSFRSYLPGTARFAVPQETQASDLLNELPPASSAVAGSTAFLRTLALWPEGLDSDLANAPGTIAIATNQRVSSESLYRTFATALSGRTNSAILSRFATGQEPRKWLASSPLGDLLDPQKQQQSCQAKLEGSQLEVVLGSPLKNSSGVPKVPQGPSQPLIAGWATVTQGKSQPIYAFAMGLKDNLLWGEVRVTAQAAEPNTNK